MEDNESFQIPFLGVAIFGTARGLRAAGTGCLAKLDGNLVEAGSDCADRGQHWLFSPAEARIGGHPAQKCLLIGRTVEVRDAARRDGFMGVLAAIPWERKAPPSAEAIGPAMRAVDALLERAWDALVEHHDVGPGRVRVSRLVSLEGAEALLAEVPLVSAEPGTLRAPVAHNQDIARVLLPDGWEAKMMLSEAPSLLWGGGIRSGEGGVFDLPFKIGPNFGGRHASIALAPSLDDIDSMRSHTTDEANSPRSHHPAVPRGPRPIPAS